MRATATAVVVATGVLTLSITAPSKGYKSVAINLSVSWDSGGVGPYKGQVTWGDGTYDAISTSTKSISKTHSYGAVGTYTISVVVADNYTAAEGTGTASVQIANPLTASLSVSPSSGNIPLAATFTIGISNGYTPYTWTLDYGDGTSPGSGSSAGTNPHTYDKVGNYTATLTVTDALGASTVSKSKLSIGIEGVTIEPILNVLAPLVTGVVLVAVAQR